MKRKIALGAICIFRYLNQINYFPQHYTWVAFSYQKFERTSRFFFLSKYFCQNIKKLKTSNPQKKIRRIPTLGAICIHLSIYIKQIIPPASKGVVFFYKKKSFKLFYF